MKDLCVSLVLIAVFAPALVGCGGGASTSPAPVATIPTSSNAALTGQWQIVAHSNVNPASSILVEANFTQSGSAVTADTSSVVLVEGIPGAFTGLAGECDNGALGDDSATATISGQTLSFTLTEAGSLGTGTSTGAATISTDGTQITGGTYQTPAACGFAADSGSLAGTAIQPLSGTFAGQLLNFAGTTDAVVVTVSQSGYTLNAVGTDAGAPITLTGKVIGATFDVTGLVQGQSREYVGIYQPDSKSFLVYDNQFQALGTLNAQAPPPAPIPISVFLSPTSSTIRVSQPQPFTATVANDAANKGVSWAISCVTANGCGSLSATSSASGAAVTYTAPAAVPSPATVKITATSVSDGTKSASATVTVSPSVVPAISVSLSQMAATVAVSETTSFAATVSGDPANKGVVWLLAGAGGCTAMTCGTLSSTTSASGTPIEYTAPSTLPSSAILLTATAVADTSKSASATITVNPGTPVPGVVGHGGNVRLNIVADVPLVAWSAGDGTHLSDGTIYAGTLEDLQAGVALTRVSVQDVIGGTLFLDGTLIGNQNSDETPVIWGTNAAWVAGGGVFTSANPTQPVYPAPAGADMLEIAADSGHLAYITELGPICSVWVDGIDIFDDSVGCPMQLKFSGPTLGWCDGQGVGIATLSSGTWTVNKVVSGLQGVSGFDFELRQDGTAVVAWTQYDLGEDGSSVWKKDGVGSAVRLSMPVKTNFSGAGNPAVAEDGSVAWLDDIHGSEPGNSDVFLDGVDLSNSDDEIDEGPRLGLLDDGTRVVAWDDEFTVWIEEVPQ